jgi:hypothetical protein
MSWRRVVDGLRAFFRAPIAWEHPPVGDAPVRGIRPLYTEADLAEAATHLAGSGGVRR